MHVRSVDEQRQMKRSFLLFFPPKNMRLEQITGAFICEKLVVKDSSDRPLVSSEPDRHSSRPQPLDGNKDGKVMGGGDWRVGWVWGVGVLDIFLSLTSSKTHSRLWRLARYVHAFCVW